MVSVDGKNHARLLWWSTSKDSTLPMQRVGVHCAGKFHMPQGTAKKKKQKQGQNQETTMHLL